MYPFLIALKKLSFKEPLILIFRSFILSNLSGLLPDVNHSSDFTFDLIGDKIFDSSLIETSDFDTIDSGSSWQTSLVNFTSSFYKNLTFFILISILSKGHEKRLGLDSILVSHKFDLIVIQESKIGIETPG